MTSKTYLKKWTKSGFHGRSRKVYSRTISFKMEHKRMISLFLPEAFLVNFKNTITYAQAEFFSRFFFNISVYGISQKTNDWYNSYELKRPQSWAFQSKPNFGRPGMEVSRYVESLENGSPCRKRHLSLVFVNRTDALSLQFHKRVSPSNVDARALLDRAFYGFWKADNIILVNFVADAGFIYNGEGGAKTWDLYAWRLSYESSNYLGSTSSRFRTPGIVLIQTVYNK